MAKGLLLAVFFTGLLLGRPCVAEQHSGSPHAAKDKAAQSSQIVPPARAVVSPPLAAPCDQQNPCYTKDAAAEELPPKWRRSEWVIVYVTVVYVLIAALTLLSIKRQANLMNTQTGLLSDSVKVARASAEAAQKSADAAERSVEAFINRERPHLTVVPGLYYSAYLSKGTTATITLYVRNVGASNAKNVSCCVSVITTATQRHPPANEWPRLARFPSLIRPSEKDEDPIQVSVPFVYEYDFSNFDWRNAEPDPSQFILDIAGLVRYEGVSGSHDLRFHYAFRSEQVSIRPSYSVDRTLLWEPKGRFEKTGEPGDNSET
jgi:hypothetical protein